MLGDRCITKETILEKIEQEIHDVELTVKRLDEEREQLKRVRKSLRQSNESDTDHYRGLKRDLMRYGSKITKYRGKVIKLQQQYKQYQNIDM